MVFESLMTASTAEKRPWIMFFMGIVYSSIAIFLSLWIFKDQSSLIMIFLTVFACIPLIYRAITLEEEKDIKIDNESVLLKEHSKVLFFLTCLFLGLMVSFSIWYLVLPEHITTDLFSSQTDTINAINSEINGSSTYTTGFATSSGLFVKILSNNLKVMLFCIFFSFFYGAGAIFILTWNASVIATAIGSFVKANISSLLHVSSVGIYSIAIMRYMTHGIFEIVAYFIGGLAGGIISVAVIKHDIGTKKFERVLLDSLDLIAISVFILILGAVIEVFVTPVLF